MRRAGTLFAVLICWVFCLLVSAGVAWAQDTAEDPSSQGDEGCANPRPVKTFSGSENQRTGPFEITGETFRIRFETEPVGEDPFLPTVEVDVLDQQDQPIGEGFLAFRGEDGTENILAGPGTFSLEIRAEEASYNITVEDCVASAGGQGGTQPADDTPGDITPSGDQYGKTPPADVSDPKDVIPGTGVKKVPNTGGPPFLAIGALALLGAALIVGRGVLRR